MPKERTLRMKENLFYEHPELERTREPLQRACSLLTHCYRSGGKLLICGNGGSAADAQHIVGELMKGFRLHRPLPPEEVQRFSRMFPEEGKGLAQGLQRALPAIALCAHTALASAVANDSDPQLVYAQNVMGYGHEGDILLGISTSGNARNVIAAAMTARAKGLSVIGLTGQSGGAIRPLCDVCLAVPQTETYLVQEQHLILYHYICAYVESELFES